MVTAAVNELLEFIDVSPTPYHATENLKYLLAGQGYQEIIDGQALPSEPGRYVVTRGGSALVALQVGTESLPESGIRFIGAHTDSPCLKLKPNPEKTSQGYAQLGIEVYGGALLNPWFDRDLSLAGKVNFKDTNGDLCAALINFKDPIAVIPSLAIHLDREANSKRTVNPQLHMSPILGGEDLDFDALLRAQIEVECDVKVDKIYDFNLSFYDTQPSAVIGFRSEFIAAARLDNLLSCFVAVKAVENIDARYSHILVFNDHEEVGSRSTVGAAGTLLDDVLAQLFTTEQERQQAISRSMMLSVDNAHGIHPNYAAKHDSDHGPKLNAGPVVKFDANQSYATGSDTASVLRHLAAQTPNIELQNFVMRADMRCGSTIGPITSTLLGVPTVDIGMPTFGMHSIRETAGAADVDTTLQLLARFLSQPHVGIYS